MTQPIIHVDRLLALTAKVLCSAVFVSGRDPDEAFFHSAPSALHAMQLPEALRRIAHCKVERGEARVDVSIVMDRDAAEILVAAHRAAHPNFVGDWDAELVRLSALGKVTQSAQYLGDQGCLILPTDGDRRICFTPVSVRDGSRWRAPFSFVPDDEVQRVLDVAFEDHQAHHAAVVVLRQGKLIGERYAETAHAEMPLESWSMGKSVISTLVGMLIGRGLLRLDQPAPIAEWQSSGDKHGAITIRHLLNMSSGLRCEGYDEPRERWLEVLPEHFYPYSEAIDVAKFATQREVEFEPGTVGRYRNCDSLALSTIFFDTVKNRLHEDPLSWPQRELFDKIGMHGFTHETDRWGRFIVSGFNYGTARDWARLGQLYLQDGKWDDETILPPGWVDLVRTPGPAWPQRNFGAQFWLNSTGEFPLPADSYYMAGGGGQYVFVAPKLDLVVVRLGYSRGWARQKAATEKLLIGLVAAVSK